MMDTQNLIAFREVALHASVSLAAKKLHLTQPAVSKRIMALEEQLNTQLFDRIGRNISLTEAGSFLLPKAQEILQLMAGAKQGLIDLSGDVKGELCLITSHHIGLHRLPKVLKEYKKLYPDVKLSIQFKNSSETYQDIMLGLGDLGITTQEEGIAQRIKSVDIWQDELLFVCAQHHPLSKIENLSLQNIAQYPAILPDLNFYTSRVVIELFKKNKLHVKIEKGLTTNYMETIMALVSIGETWSVLPKTMLEVTNLNSNYQKVVAIKPKESNLSRKLVCIYHQQRSLNNASRAFLELLRADK